MSGSLSCLTVEAGIVKVIVAPLRFVMAFAIINASPAFAQRLGGGQSPQISLAWIITVLGLCIVVAVLAAIWIRMRHDRGAGAIFSWRILKERVRRQDDFLIVSTRRAGLQTDIALVRWRGREFLLAMSAGQLLLLGDAEAEPQTTVLPEEE